MYGTVRHEVRIHRPAAEVWALAGDPARLHEWFPGIDHVEIDGTRRTVTTATGMPLPEEMLVCDNTLRRFQYRVDLPMIAHHRGTIDVIDLGDDSCLAVYSTEADPRTMALTIGGGTRGALVELKRLMEAPCEETA